MGFEVVVADIRSAAKKLKSAADGVKGADPSADVSPIGTAMTGSKSAAAATELETAWQKRFQGWYDDAISERDGLVTNADGYDASDYRADLRAQRAENKMNLGY